MPRRYPPLPLGEGGRVLIFVCEVVLLGVGDKRRLVCKFPLRHRLSPTPVFLGFPFHRWRGGVLALDPVRLAPRAVGRVLPLRHHALKAHLASVREHERAVLLVEVLIEPKPGRRASEQAGTARTTPWFGRGISYGGTWRARCPFLV